MDNNIEVLEEVLDVLEDEKKKFYNLVDQNDFRIEEINSYFRKLSEREDEDYKVFSPRNVENTHREQIQADKNEKKKYEEENAEYFKKIEFLKNLIDKVNVVIANLQSENKDGIKPEPTESDVSDGAENGEDDLYKKKMNEKDIDVIEGEYRHAAYQILNCVSYITPDAERAKIELTALAKKLLND